jgi:nucleoside phosphorylase
LRFIKINYQLALPHHQAFQVYHGKFENINVRHSVVLMHQRSQGSAGSDSSQATVEKLLEFFTPRIVVTVVCAFGFDNDKQKILDILVSNIILPYEKVRVGKVEENRNPQQFIESSILGLIQNGLSSWKFVKSKNSISSVNCEVHQGAMLCGEKLVDNDEFKKHISKLISSGEKISGQKIIGGEMEGSGMFSACEDHRSLPCIVIKGVSDYGVNKEGASEDETAQLLNYLFPGIDVNNVIVELKNKGNNNFFGDEDHRTNDQKVLRKLAFQRLATFGCFSLLVHCFNSSLCGNSLPQHWAPPTTFSPNRNLSKVPRVVAENDPHYESLIEFINAHIQLEDAKNKSKEVAKVNKSNEELQKVLTEAQADYATKKAAFDQSKKNLVIAKDAITPSFDDQKQRFDDLEEDWGQMPWNFPSSVLTATVNHVEFVVERRELAGKIKYSLGEIEKYMAPDTLSKLVIALRPEPEIKFKVGKSKPEKKASNKRKRDSDDESRPGEEDKARSTNTED